MAWVDAVLEERASRLRSSDRPERVGAHPNVVAEAPADSRIEGVGGDFFKDVPVQADAYVLRW
jgi:hypothetical protein